MVMTENSTITVPDRDDNRHHVGVRHSCMLVMQDNGLVPIVEPEMTLGPGDYTIEDTSYWSERVLTHVFRHLNEHDVMLEGILMKPSMCLPG